MLTFKKDPYSVVGGFDVELALLADVYINFFKAPGRVSSSSKPSIQGNFIVTLGIKR